MENLFNLIAFVAVSAMIMLIYLIIMYVIDTYRNKLTNTNRKY